MFGIYHRMRFAIRSYPCALLLLIIPDADEVAGNAEGRPRDVEPSAAGE